jgi:hypothetical protein
MYAHTTFLTDSSYFRMSGKWYKLLHSLAMELDSPLQTQDISKNLMSWSDASLNSTGMEATGSKIDSLFSSSCPFCCFTFPCHLSFYPWILLYPFTPRVILSLLSPFVYTSPFLPSLFLLIFHLLPFLLLLLLTLFLSFSSLPSSTFSFPSFLYPLLVSHFLFLCFYIL